jgi:hypothetical protein
LPGSISASLPLADRMCSEWTATPAFAASPAFETPAHLRAHVRLCGASHRETALEYPSVSLWVVPKKAPRGELRSITFKLPNLDIYYLVGPDYSRLADNFTSNQKSPEDAHLQAPNEQPYPPFSCASSGE